MKILNSHWFNNRDGCTGVVKVQTDYEGIKYYIGHASGEDEESDSQYIAEWGSTFPFQAGEILVN